MFRTRAKLEIQNFIDGKSGKTIDRSFSNILRKTGNKLKGLYEDGFS